MISNQPPTSVSIVMPVFNEGTTLAEVLSRLDNVMKSSGLSYEIIVVDDGSEDRTLSILQSSLVPLTLLHNPVNMGYGFSLQRGICAARHEVIAVTSADGTYPLEVIPTLVKEMANADMVVGARTGGNFRGSFLKRSARRLLYFLADYIADSPIPDLNSGLRVFKKELVLDYEDRVNDGLPFAATITFAAFLTHRFVKYIPVSYGAAKRTPTPYEVFRGVQALVEMILIYNPAKIFLPLCLIPFLTAFFLLPFLVFKSLSNVALGLTVGVSGSCLILSLGFIAVILSRSKD